VGGETSWAVPPLACPAVAAPAAAVLASDAVALFVTRARERHSGFDPARLAPHQLSQLCRRLDGLPLAIELIAGWVGTLSVPEIVERHTALLSGAGPDRGQHPGCSCPAQLRPARPGRAGAPVSPEQLRRSFHARGHQGADGARRR
jgi:hypothetical protein